jgi:preprotein translocase subunit SecD
LLASNTVVAEGDVTRVEVVPRPEPSFFAIQIHLIPEAAKRLDEASLENMGGRLAIVIDGKILATPKITRAFSSPVSIQGPYSLMEATQIAQRLAL